MPDEFEEISELLKALAHPLRLEIVESLRERERSVKALVELLHVGQSNLSQHLALMRRVGILECRRDGMCICYSIRTRVVLRVVDIMKQMGNE